MQNRATAKRRRRRPLGVVILVVVELLYAALVVLSLTVEGVEVDLRFFPSDAAPLLALSSVVLAVGLWRLQHWAWTLMMLWTGLGLTADLVDYIRGDASYALMLESVIVVFYLNQRDVQHAFHGRHAEEPLEAAG
jgi:hypothetical protein